MALTPGEKLGRYEIRSKIGAGGTGEVYLAEDTRLHRKVALKILPADTPIAGKLVKTLYLEYWCRRGDSNPHELPHTPLKRARLPVPPLRRAARPKYIAIACG